MGFDGLIITMTDINGNTKVSLGKDYSGIIENINVLLCVDTVTKKLIRN